MDKVDYRIYDHIWGTKSGEEPSLVHFDRVTQHSSNAPQCAWESIYCHCDPTPFECEYKGLGIDNELHKYDPNDEEGSAFKICLAKEEGKEEDNGDTAMCAKVDTL